MNKAKKMQKVLFQQAIDALQPFDQKAEPLREIARLIIERNR
jgi:geranylgeranyl pyrophosphate synthase